MGADLLARIMLVSIIHSLFLSWTGCISIVLDPYECESLWRQIGRAHV